VSGAADIAAQVTAAANSGADSKTSKTPPKSYYQRLVERRSADEENVLKDVHRTLIHYGA
jgi:hypothetical protein